MSLEGLTNNKENNEENYEEKPIGFEEAREEANMMKVKLKEIIGHELTVEDYDKALKMVEEMKNAAANQSEASKNFWELWQDGSRIMDKSAQVLAYILSLGKIKMDNKSIEEDVKIWDDAESKLNRLKREAEQLGQNESK